MFLLTYLKTYSLQVVQGRMFGMGQSKADQWIHVLLPALLAALAQRLDVAETAGVITPPEAPPRLSLEALLPGRGAGVAPERDVHGVLPKLPPFFNFGCSPSAKSPSASPTTPNCPSRESTSDFTSASVLSVFFAMEAQPTG